MVEVLEGSLRLFYGIYVLPIRVVIGRIVNVLRRYFSFLVVVLGLGLVGYSFYSASFVSAGFGHVSELPEDKMKNLKSAWEAGIKAGLSESAIAGMLGNANAESGLDPFIGQNGGPAWGFFQYESERQTKVRALLKEQGATDDPVKASAVTIEFAVSELKEGNIFLTYGLEGNASGTGRYGSSGGAFNYNALEYVQGDGKKISASYDDWKSSKDVAKATTEFMVSYERPNPSYAHLSERIAFAKEVYEKLSGTASSDSSDDSSSGKKSKSTSDTLSNWKPSEADIPNMPTDRDYLELKNNGLAKGEENYHNFTDRVGDKDKVDEDFKKGSDEAESVQKWKEERSLSVGDRAISVFRLAIATLSVIFLFYGVLLMVSFAFDLWLPFIDSPLMRLMTFNRLAVVRERVDGSVVWFSNKSENRHLSVKRVGLGDILVWVFIFSGIGVMGVTGYLYSSVGGALQYIMDTLGYFGHLGGS